MKKFKFLLSAFLSFATVLGVNAQETAEAAEAESEFEFSAGADLVSSYIWRGQKLAGSSIQPALGVSYKGFSLGAWGSTDFEDLNFELDWSLGYSAAGFGIMVTDYYGNYRIADKPAYFAEKSHILEGTVSYDFAEACDKFALTVAWSTNFLNDLDGEGEERYSSYLELGYPVSVKGLDLALALGITPFEGAYADEFNVVNISIKASKEIKITDHFSLPVFTQVMLNPDAEEIYCAFGISF